MRITVDDDLRRSRLTVFFRLLLAIPHLIWLAALDDRGRRRRRSSAGWSRWCAARLPDGLHDFLAAYVRYATHVGAYLALAANPYPGFTGAPGYPVDVEIPAARSRSPAGRSPFASCSRSRP